MNRLQLDTCRSCGAAIRWAKSPAGANLPLDAKPITGHVTQRRPGAIIGYALDELGGNSCRSLGWVLPVNALQLDEHDVECYVSHFATCEHAASHSKRPRR